MEISEKIMTMPEKPGVYIMKDAGGNIIYIGKAKNLQRRVSSYFHKRADNLRLEALVFSVADIETVITDNEIEALILESNLIRKHKPKFNIELKDNQKYPYIKITNEEYPRIVKTRIKTDDSSLYFGPYPNVKHINRTIRTITDIFPIIRCKRSFPLKGAGLNRAPLAKARLPRAQLARAPATCMNYYLGKCVCPYINEVSTDEYARLVEQVVLFLKGQNTRLLTNIRKEMAAESHERHFEKAIQLRERYRAVKNLLEDQKITSLKGENEDIFGTAQLGDTCCVTLLTRRDGKIIGKRDFIFAESTGEEDVLEQFLDLFYQQDAALPQEAVAGADEFSGASYRKPVGSAEKSFGGSPPHAVLLPFELENIDALREYLKTAHERAVAVYVPQRGAKRRLVELARKNACQRLQEELFRYDPEEAGTALKDLLGLEQAPRSIEAFDISTTLGTLPVASMVRFDRGIPEKKNYRMFRMRYTEEQNDVEMMKEAVGRRYQRLLNEEKPLPDLVLVDGGVPQLNAAREVLDSLGLRSLTAIGLAKRQEEIYAYGRKDPFSLEKNSDALRLLMAVRNEAHRFANAYHLKLRGKDTITTRLTSIPGIGEELAKSILASIEDIRAVRSPVELTRIKGVGSKRAQQVFRVLRDSLAPEDSGARGDSAAPGARDASHGSPDNP